MAFSTLISVFADAIPHVMLVETLCIANKHKTTVSIFANKHQAIVAILILCLLAVVEPPEVTVVSPASIKSNLPARSRLSSSPSNANSTSTSTSSSRSRRRSRRGRRGRSSRSSRT